MHDIGAGMFVCCGGFWESKASQYIWSRYPSTGSMFKLWHQLLKLADEISDLILWCCSRWRRRASSRSSATARHVLPRSDEKKKKKTPTCSLSHSLSLCPSLCLSLLLRGCRGSASVSKRATYIENIGEKEWNLSSWENQHQRHQVDGFGRSNS